MNNSPKHSWLNNPKYVQTKNRLIGKLKDLPTSQNYQPVVFLCGGKNSSRRKTIKAYINKQWPAIHVFYAEDAWSIVKSHSYSDSLQMENDLAELSDMILLIVESPGTFTELGAFGAADKLRKKMFVIIDEKYKQDEDSFVASGPVKWINKESSFKPTVYAPFKTILSASKEIDIRLEKIRPPRNISPPFMPEPIQHGRLLFWLVVNLITVIGPSPEGHIRFYANHTFPTSIKSITNFPNKLTHMIAFCKAIGIVYVDKNGMYDRSRIVSGSHEEKWYRISNKLASLRADHLQALMSIEETRPLVLGN